MGQDVTKSPADNSLQMALAVGLRLPENCLGNGKRLAATLRFSGLFASTDDGLRPGQFAMANLAVMRNPMAKRSVQGH